MNPVTVHLERQLTSGRRLLQIVLAQHEAIRAQDVEAVMARLADVQQEMVKRIQLERERDQLLERAASSIGCSVEQVTLEDMLRFVPTGDAERAREMSAELRGVLDEVSRIHAQNRILIRQELSFLDHLLRVLSGTPEGGYAKGGTHSAGPQTNNLIDMRV
ncbi:MAG: flagellar protein FlgN [Gaiellales bacterium]